MITTSRRTTMLASAALVAAPAILSGAARAQPAATGPAVAGQAPGFHRFKVGAFIVTTVNDGFFTRPTQGFVRNAPQAEVERVLAEAFLPAAQLPIPFTITFVQTGRQLIAFDAGTGGQLAPTAGRMGENLRAAGIDPAQVDLVVHSHFHADHITGLTTRDDAPVFTRAEVAVPEAEWRFWTDEGAASRAPEGQRPTFANTRRRFAPYQARLRQFGDGAEVAPGVRAISAPGHTPGHTVFLVADGSEQLLVLGDLANRPELFVRNPGWHAVFDQDAALAEQSRRRVLDRAAADRARVTGYHFPFPATGYVAKEGNGYRFVAAEWSSAV